MFNFLTKSRAFKFLCSSCLLCSLGAFSSVYADDPVIIGSGISQSPLGTDPGCILLDDTATIDGTTGVMSGGTFKWKTSGTRLKLNSYGEKLYKKGSFEGILSEAKLDAFNNPPDNISDILISLGLGYSVIPVIGGNWYYAPIDSFFGSTDNEAWRTLLKDYSDIFNMDQVLSKAGYSYATEENDLLPLYNDNENSKLALFLKKDGEYKAATAEISLNSTFTLSNVQFYNATTADVADPDTATKFSGDPGQYEILGILTSKGDKTIISGPVMGA